MSEVHYNGSMTESMIKKNDSFNSCCKGIVGEKLLELVKVQIRRRQNVSPGSNHSAIHTTKVVHQTVVGIPLFYVQLRRPPMLIYIDMHNLRSSPFLKNIFY